MSNHSRNGKCLCGKITLSIEAASNKVEACHCSICRTWSGPLPSFTGCKELSIKGIEWVGVYKSSKWTERAFGKSCGSYLYYKLIETGNMMVPPGLMEPNEELELNLEVSIDEKPAFYDFLRKAKNSQAKK